MEPTRQAEDATTEQPASPADWELAQLVPNGPLRALVSRITHYRETRPGLFRQRESASLFCPLIISFGEPFLIALGRDPQPVDRHTSFAAGLYAGPVVIESSGASHCIQIDFTPLGARAFFGLPMHMLADRMMLADDVLGQDANRLRERLGNTRDIAQRLAIAQDHVERRLDTTTGVNAGSAIAYRRLCQSGGRRRIDRIAEEVGWSRKHLATRFREDFGLGAKTIARMIRFQTALAQARRGNAAWADIAASCGYADQAHLVREFRAMSGTTPTAIVG